MSQLNDTLKALTKQYVDTQAQVDMLYKQLGELRDKKKHIESALVGQIKQAGLSSYGITYQGRKVYIGNEITYDTLTYKYLETCLMSLYHNDKEKVKSIITYIKQHRQKQSNQTIKIGKTN
jgi:hypothetical protein